LAQVKFTKNEMGRLQKKLVQLKKYLPTLQLKKMLLQAEVNKAQEEIARYHRMYKEEIITFETSMKLLSDPSVKYLKNDTLIKDKSFHIDNIAGIEVPVLSSVSFKKSEDPLTDRPFWHNDMVVHLRSTKKAFLMWKTAEKKKSILSAELRSVSIRVNLFEKRLIPGTISDMVKIKIFLGDQDLAAVSLSKLAKEKIEKRKLEEEERALCK
jgi:V/A-type H+-transporting ATPase subunit D